MRGAWTMDHWRSHFVNRPLPRSLYLSVRWACLTELWVAYNVKQALSRLRFLRTIEVDFDRVDREQELQYQVQVNVVRLGHPPRYQPPRPAAHGPAPLLVEQARGVWV